MATQFSLVCFAFGSQTGLFGLSCRALFGFDTLALGAVFGFLFSARCSRLAVAFFLFDPEPRKFFTFCREPSLFGFVCNLCG
ncbi:hypothetical protein WI75_04800 [Burkholderia ubonensis]|nr:hypothetical protein WI75_04800 [Burkholderia ubonensis]KWN80826.1 hypothetical protein WM24_23610 [Burkholderia ubonensis]